jgi:hypothetical protein
MSLTFTRAEGDKSPSLQIRDSKGKELWRSTNRESKIGKQDREDKSEYDAEFYRVTSHSYLTQIENQKEKGPYAWKARTYEEPRFTLQDNGNAIIWFENDVVWDMRERIRGIDPQPKDTLRALQFLRVGDCLMSKNMEYACELQADGNLIMYDNGQAIWSTKTEGTEPRVYLEEDGNLVVKDGRGNVKWQTRGGYTGEVKLVMQNDGDLVTFAAGQKVWSRYQQPEGWKDPKILGTRWGYKAS